MDGERPNSSFQTPGGIPEEEETDVQDIAEQEKVRGHAPLISSHWKSAAEVSASASPSGKPDAGPTSESS
jgi:hypothetical protein